MESEENSCQVLGSGPVLVGGGVRSFGSVLKEEIIHAKDEILLAIYVISPNALDTLDLIETKLAEDITVKLVVNQFDKLNKKVQVRLNELVNKYQTFFLMDFTPKGIEGDMHAKAVVFDRKVALVGSTNLSFHGLVSGHEISLRVIGKPASLVANAIDKLLSNIRSKRR
jgi:cardiolipin synthase